MDGSYTVSPNRSSWSARHGRFFAHRGKLAMFRPPALNGPTLGGPPRDTAAASDEIAFPLTVSMPPFPRSAAGSGVVLLEAQVDRDGHVSDPAVIHSAPPFDAAARAVLT